MPLYCLGSNGSGQLGLGHDEDVSVPTLVPLPKGLDMSKPVKVVAGGNHTVLMTGAGQTLASGLRDHGRTGVDVSGSNGTAQVFVPVQSATAQTSLVKHCAATWETTAFVLEDDQVLTCGHSGKGELGQGTDQKTSIWPSKVDSFPPAGTSIVDISASMSHMVAVLCNGDVYGWGNGRKGQLGQPLMANCWSPRKVSGIPFEAVRVACGREFTFIVGSPESGNHIVLGNDKWNVVSDAPPCIPGWKDIGASWGSIYVLFQSGEARSWGRNDHGQLFPKTLPPISMIAIGSEHGLAVSTTNKVLAWGWGEHGNCGSPTESNGDVKDRYNELDVQGHVVGIGAGCATSWIHTSGSSPLSL